MGRRVCNSSCGRTGFGRRLRLKRLLCVAIFCFRPLFEATLLESREGHFGFRDGWRRGRLWWRRYRFWFWFWFWLWR